MEAILYKFYSELKQGRVLGRKCLKCGSVAFPPRGLCSCCGSKDADWVEISGKGKLLFASAGPNLLLGTPYIMATVQLEEGPIVAGVLLDDSFDFAHPESILRYNCTGMQVRVEVGKSPRGGVIVAFRQVHS